MANNTYHGQPIKYFLIDRLAAGFPRPQACILFRRFFEVIDSDEEILKIIDYPEIDSDIEERRKNLLLEIEKTNLIGIVFKHISALDELATSSGDTEEKLQILNTLQRFIESAKPKERKEEAPKQVNITNYNQINAAFITDLEKDGVISVLNREKFQQLFGLLPPAGIPPQQSPDEIPLSIIRTGKLVPAEKKEDDGEIGAFV